MVQANDGLHANAAWTHAEEVILVEAVEEFGTKRWADIAKVVGLNRHVTDRDGYVLITVRRPLHIGASFVDDLVYRCCTHVLQCEVQYTTVRHRFRSHSGTCQSIEMYGFQVPLSSSARLRYHGTLIGV